MENEEELKVEKNNWAKSCLLGFFLGLAVIIPGVSGATIAIIFLMYEPLLSSISKLFREFKKSFLFLLPIGLGFVVGFIVGFFAVQKLFLIYPIILISLFIGLMAGALPVVFDEVKGEQKTPIRVFLFILGLVIPILVSVFALLFNSGEASISVNITFGKIVIFFVLGVVISLTQIIPGLSATALLIAVNEYSFLLSCVHLSAIRENSKILLIFLALVLGFVLGLIVFSRVIDKILKTHKVSAFFLICGLSVSSIIAMAISPEVISKVKELTGNSLAIQITISIALFAIGVIISSLILKHKKQKEMQK